MLRCGFVAIVGRPNVGKSTLLNRLLGQKVAITSSRVQTTRYRIRGVITLPEKGQVVLIDTPGFSKAIDKLGEFLTGEAIQALTDADAYLFVVDASHAAGKGDAWLAEQLIETGKPIVLVLNKTDLIKDNPQQMRLENTYKALFESYPTITSVTLSAKTGRHVAKLPEQLVPLMPEAPMIYDEDTVTDQRMREIAQEMIREKAMRLTQEEIPHSIAVMIDSFDESDPACSRIQATLYVDHPSQKGIVIGQGGQLIKQIGSQARQDIEAMIDGKVFLRLNVKVKRHWRQDPQFLKQLGLTS